MRSSATEALDKLGWKSLEKIRLIHRLTMAFKYLHGHIDIDLDVKLNRNVHSHDTRRRNDVRLPLTKRNLGQQRCIYHIFKDWNNLDYSLREIDCLMNFKYSIDRFHLTSQRPYWCTKTMKWRPYWCTVQELALSYSNISYCFTTPLGPPIT